MQSSAALGRAPHAHALSSCVAVCPALTGAICPLAPSDSWGGGPSIVKDRISSPRSTTNPSTLRSSLCKAYRRADQVRGRALRRPARRSGREAARTRTSSSDLPFLGGSLLNSSESPSTRFKCRSNAMNLHSAGAGARRGCDRDVQFQCFPRPAGPWHADLVYSPAHDLPAIDEGHPHACAGKDGGARLKGDPPQQQERPSLRMGRVAYGS